MHKTPKTLLRIKKTVNKKLGYDALSIDVVTKGKKKNQTALKRSPNIGRKKKNDPLEVQWAWEMTYEEFGRKYRYDDAKTKKCWFRRKRSEDAIVRLYMGHVGTEYFYLRKLLREIKGPQSIESLLIHPEKEGVEFSSYKEACVALKLVDSHKEYYHCTQFVRLCGRVSYQIMSFVEVWQKRTRWDLVEGACWVCLLR